MNDVIFIYPSVTTVIDTAIRFPITSETLVDFILLIDNSPILQINMVDQIYTGH